MNKFTAISPFLSFIASIIGIICYFTNITTVTIICGIITLLDSAAQVFWGSQKNFNTEFITIVIGIIIALIFKLSIFPCVFLCLCIGSALLTVIGWVFLFFS